MAEPSYIYVNGSFFNDIRLPIAWLGQELFWTRFFQFCCAPTDTPRTVMRGCGFTDEDLKNPSIVLYWNAAGGGGGPNNPSILDTSFQSAYGDQNEAVLNIWMPAELERQHILVEHPFVQELTGLPRLARPGVPVCLADYFIKDPVKNAHKWCPLVV